MCGASLTLVTNVADICRYTPTRATCGSADGVALLAAAVTTLVAAMQRRHR